MLISICIPTYSRLEYLKQAVDSCLKQKYEAFEICVSQDPKPDGLDNAIKTYCEEMVKLYPNKFRYNFNTKNLGLAGNWNVCVRIAKGDYLIIIGDDDLLSEDFLTAMVAALNSQKNIAVIFCNQYFINERNELLKEKTDYLNEHYNRNSLSEGLLMEPVKTVFNRSIPSSSSLIRRDLLLKYPFDERLNTPELEVFLKIAIAGEVFYYINKQLASYRLHAQSATSKGLTIHYFVKNLINMEIPIEFEYLRCKLISNFMIVAVNCAIKSNNRHLAFELLKSKYYPLNKIHYRITQFVILLIPNFISRKLL